MIEKNNTILKEDPDHAVFLLIVFIWISLQLISKNYGKNNHGAQPAGPVLPSKRQ